MQKSDLNLSTTLADRDYRKFCFSNRAVHSWNSLKEKEVKVQNTTEFKFINFFDDRAYDIDVLSCFLNAFILFIV